jgi:glutathione S-transferase
MTNHRLTRLTLHEHPFAAYCWKPLIALYELGLDFDRQIATDEASRAELAQIWPLAKIPVLVDATAGVMIPESTTIVEYVDELASGTLVPTLQARLWDRFHDNYVANPMQKIVGDNLRPDDRRDPHGVTEARATIDTAYEVLDTQLAENEWTAGEQFTIADCAAAPALFYTHAIHRWHPTNHPNITRYYHTLVHRPSITRVIDEARPYRNLFPMAWPEDVDVD